MPDGLHEFAVDGKCKKVAELIAAGADVNRVNIYGNSPLYSLLVAINDEPTIDQYCAIILLLEAGANPLQPHPGDEFWKINYPLFDALEKKHLAQVLLLLWYTPENYKTVTVVSEKYRFSYTFQSYIEMTGEIEIKKNKHRDYVRWVNETAADAKEVRTLLAEAKRCLEITPRAIENDVEAARCYNQAAQIYQKHEEREDSLVYFWPSYMRERSATPKQLHALFRDYYRQKKLSCLESEFNCAQRVQRELDEKGVNHIEVIDRLIELSKLLGKEADLLFYLDRAAKVMMQLPDRRVYEATTVSDDEVTVEFHERAEVDSERASLLEHKPAAASLFGSLRRRHTAAVVVEVGHRSPTATFKI